jgi:archaellum component FlaC
VQSKFNEMMAKNERVERELNTKRRILGDYDEVKKAEIDLLNWKAEMQRNRITNLEMHVEDVSSEGIRLKEKYTEGVRKIEELEIKLIEEKARVKEMEAE